MLGNWSSAYKPNLTKNSQDEFNQEATQIRLIPSPPTIQEDNTKYFSPYQKSFESTLGFLTSTSASAFKNATDEKSNFLKTLQHSQLQESTIKKEKLNTLAPSTTHKKFPSVTVNIAKPDHFNEGPQQEESDLNGNIAKSSSSQSEQNFHQIKNENWDQLV